MERLGKRGVTTGTLSRRSRTPVLTGGAVTTALIGLAWLTRRRPACSARRPPLATLSPPHCGTVVSRAWGAITPAPGAPASPGRDDRDCVLRGAGACGRTAFPRQLVAGAGARRTIAIDGSTTAPLFEFYTPIYQLHNTLRLFTGLVAGAAMITVFAGLQRDRLRKYRRDALITGWRDLAALLVALALAGPLVLTRLSVAVDRRRDQRAWRGADVRDRRRGAVCQLDAPGSACPPLADLDPGPRGIAGGAGDHEDRRSRFADGVGRLPSGWRQIY